MAQSRVILRAVTQSSPLINKLQLRNSFSEPVGLRKAFFFSKARRGKSVYLTAFTNLLLTFTPTFPLSRGAQKKRKTKGRKNVVCRKALRLYQTTQATCRSSSFCSSSSVPRGPLRHHRQATSRPTSGTSLARSHICGSSTAQSTQQNSWRLLPTHQCSNPLTDAL